MTQINNINCASNSGPRKSDKYIPYYIIAFFCTFITLDMFFVYTAVSTYQGVVNDNAYRDGVKYNEQLEEARRRQEIGWISNINFEPQEKLSLSGMVVINTTDKHGRSLVGKECSGTISRPLQKGLEQELQFTSEKGGICRSQLITLPSAGQWQVEANIAHNKEAINVKERLILGVSNPAYFINR